jgi:hypothetical protein
MSNQDWQKDLNPASVQREAAANVKPRVILPDIGQSISVVFTSEPRLISNVVSHLGRDFYVADVDDGSGIPKQIVCSKSMRQHLAAMIARGDMNMVTGAHVTITGRIIPEYRTSDGRVVYNAKVYDVVLLNPIAHGQPAEATPPAQTRLGWVLQYEVPDIPDHLLVDMGPLADNTDNYE